MMFVNCVRRAHKEMMPKVEQKGGFRITLPAASSSGRTGGVRSPTTAGATSIALTRHFGKAGKQRIEARAPSM